MEVVVARAELEEELAEMDEAASDPAAFSTAEVPGCLGTRYPARCVIRATGPAGVARRGGEAAEIRKREASHRHSPF